LWDDDASQIAATSIEGMLHVILVVTPVGKIGKAASNLLLPTLSGYQVSGG
jgi:hypothetical protein